MVGITLLPEQIREAPPEVRRWLEAQIAGAWPGAYRAAPTLEPPARHLVASSLDDARAILSLIHGLLPVVSVFFELGREPAAASARGLRALRLDDMLRHSRLQGVEQIIACLKIVDEALQRVRGEPDAALTALDATGHCVVADATARSILELWQEIVAPASWRSQASCRLPRRKSHPGRFRRLLRSRFRRSRHRRLRVAALADFHPWQVDGPGRKLRGRGQMLCGWAAHRRAEILAVVAPVGLVISACDGHGPRQPRAGESNSGQMQRWNDSRIRHRAHRGYEGRRETLHRTPVDLNGLYLW
jgi:hypothetical protein